MSAPMWNVVTRRFFKKTCSSCGILSNFTPTQAILLRQSRSMTTISKMKTKFDESVKDVLETTSHRTHPGIVRPKAVMLPERLQRSIDVVLQSYTGRQLADKSQVLFNYLWSRKRPVEVNQLRKQAIVLAKQMGLEDEKRRYNDTELLEVKERNILKQKKKTVIMQLKKKLYHWKAIQYTKEMGMVYIASKMASNYSAIYRVLYE
ncbi:ribosome assembly protein METTL17, mitochondrial-like, partial [Saccoglossus kowalevskii]|uniref:Methyltransferase-like protein 17, mitochondrial-like n=1 Tax=Saccoglossus kowalevskii TaxID=10224 RepID=A0ABM0MA78_SACKO